MNFKQRARQISCLADLPEGDLEVNLLHRNVRYIKINTKTDHVMILKIVTNWRGEPEKELEIEDFADLPADVQERIEKKLIENTPKNT